LLQSIFFSSLQPSPPQLPQQKHNLTIGILLDPQQKKVKFLQKKNPRKISFTQASLLPQIPQRTTQKKMILIDLKIARSLSLSLSLVARSHAHNLALSSPCTLS
jgi:hypothetical protein